LVESHAEEVPSDENLVGVLRAVVPVRVIQSVDLQHRAAFHEEGDHAVVREVEDLVAEVLLVFASVDLSEALHAVGVLLVESHAVEVLSVEIRVVEVLSALPHAAEVLWVEIHVAEVL